MLIIKNFSNKLSPTHPEITDDNLKNAVQRCPSDSILVLEDVDALFTTALRTWDADDVNAAADAAAGSAGGAVRSVPSAAAPPGERLRRPPPRNAGLQQLGDAGQRLGRPREGCHTPSRPSRSRGPVPPLSPRPSDLCLMCPVLGRLGPGPLFSPLATSGLTRWGPSCGGQVSLLSPP